MNYDDKYKAGDRVVWGANGDLYDPSYGMIKEVRLRDHEMLILWEKHNVAFWYGFEDKDISLSETNPYDLEPIT